MPSFIFYTYFLHQFCIFQPLYNLTIFHRNSILKIFWIEVASAPTWSLNSGFQPLALSYPCLWWFFVMDQQANQKSDLKNAISSKVKLKFQRVKSNWSYLWLVGLPNVCSKRDWAVEYSSFISERVAADLKSWSGWSGVGADLNCWWIFKPEAGRRWRHQGWLAGIEFLNIQMGRTQPIPGEGRSQPHTFENDFNRFWSSWPEIMITPPLWS